MIGVGILISNNNNISDSLFSNGLIQNCLNLYDLINSIDGYKPYFMCVSSEETFSLMNKNLKKINYELVRANLDNINKLKIKAILEAGSFSDVLFKVVKEKKPDVKFVSIEYGNPLFFNIEYSVFKKDKLFACPKDRDEVWYSPHFQFSHDFISELSRCDRVKTCPFIWSEKFLLHNINKYNIDTKRFSNQFSNLFSNRFSNLFSNRFSIWVLNRLSNRFPNRFSNRLSNMFFQSVFYSAFQSFLQSVLQPIVLSFFL